MIKVEKSGRAALADKEVEKVIKKALMAARIKKAYVSVAFVSSSEIRKWNNIYRNKNEATDILSFGFNKAVGDAARWKVAGELLISEREARANAKDKKSSLKKELQLLLTHGALHLAGYDHEKKSEELLMFALQDKILKSII